MIKLLACDSNGICKDLGVFSSLHSCSEEIAEWEYEESNIGTNIGDYNIKAFDTETGCVYNYRPIDPTQEPTEQYDPASPNDWLIEMAPIS